jgi:hypothetical protein
VAHNLSKMNPVHIVKTCFLIKYGYSKLPSICPSFRYARRPVTVLTTPAQLHNFLKGVYCQGIL